jgi:hypothetical protein
LTNRDTSVDRVSSEPETADNSAGSVEDDDDESKFSETVADDLIDSVTGGSAYFVTVSSECARSLDAAEVVAFSDSLAYDNNSTILGISAEVSDEYLASIDEMVYSVTASSDSLASVAAVIGSKVCNAADDLRDSVADLVEIPADSEAVKYGFNFDLTYAAVSVEEASNSAAVASDDCRLTEQLKLDWSA